MNSAAENAVVEKIKELPEGYMVSYDMITWWGFVAGLDLRPGKNYCWSQRIKNSLVEKGFLTLDTDRRPVYVFGGVSGSLPRIWVRTRLRAGESILDYYQVELRVAEEDGEQCSICLGEQQAQEEVAVLTCSHSFHSACFGRWTLSGPFLEPFPSLEPFPPHSTCPLCRASVARH